MRQKLQLENRQTAVQFWKHDHFHKDCPLWKSNLAKYAYNVIWMEARLLLVLNAGSHWLTWRVSQIQTVWIFLKLRPSFFSHF
jgi:hypothetical protein